MNVNLSRVLLGLVAAVIGGSNAGAAPVPVQLDLANLRCIQNYDVNEQANDPIYLTVTGVAKGAEVSTRLPESGTMEANKKKPPLPDEQPVALWKGELGDGEFALLTVTLYQGTGDDAGKAFATKLADATKGIAERSKQTLTADEGKALAASTLKAQQAVVIKVKETLSREKKTDHLGGVFNVLIVNNAGAIVKRLDPIGLTAGEHYGIDEKVYTKIKHTLPNVTTRDPDGQFFPQPFPPISEDNQTVRVKMLENEYVKIEKDGSVRNKKNTTDYLADVQLQAGGKPVAWKLGGEHVGPTQVHMYWDFAE